ncbi:hypothetical protein Q3C01_18415 [Bradyrhizobium sp. UFLA05-109]
MHRSMWTYGWDLLDMGFDRVIDELRDRAGVNSVSLATSYHAGRFLQPRSPVRKAYFPEDGTIYFHPTPSRWDGVAIRPKVADIIAQGGDVLRELVRRRDTGGLKVCCWTVCLHNTRLGLLHPGVTTRNAFGDPNHYSLCPSHPDARAYVCALVEDVTHAYRPDIVELESPSFMGFAHEFHHEKDGVGLTAEDDFALSLCFCECCRARAGAAGVDAEAARRLVVQWIVEACERETPQPRFPEFPARGLDSFRQFPALYEYLLWRTEPVTSLIAEMKARAHADSRIVLIDVANGWLGGCDLEAIGKVCDGAILCVYGRSPDECAATLTQGKAALGDEKFLGAGLRVFPHDVAGAEGLRRQVDACVRAGAKGLNFYNYGLVPAPRLDWIGRTLEGLPVQ